MQNMTSTRWLDQKNTDLAAVEKLLMRAHPDENSQTTASYMKWKVEKAFINDESAVFNGKKIVYNLFRYSVDQIPSGMMHDEDATIRKTGFVIPYLTGGKIRYIISRNSGAMTMLRKLLFYTGKNEIVRNDFSFSGDLFVWLISKIYNSENVFESESDELANLTIDSVRGFKGDTEDLLTKVTAVGESVIKIISTLSFLLESHNLNQIKVDVQYRSHTNIDVTLSSKNTVSTDIDRYQGSLLQNYNLNNETAVVFMLLYTEILPILFQSYQGEVDSNQWNSGKCVEFLKKVAEDLSEKVSKRVEELLARPEQLRMKMDKSVSASEE